MLQKSVIDKFYDDIEQLRRLGIKKLNAEVERRTGESKGNVSEYLNRKKEPSEAFLKKFYEGFGNVLKNASVGELETNYGHLSGDASLSELIQINKNLSAAARQAEENRKELISEVRAIRLALTAGFDPKMIQAVQASTTALQEFVLDVATRDKKFQTRELAAAALGKWLNEFAPKTGRDGTHDSSGKQSKRKA